LKHSAALAAPFIQSSEANMTRGPSVSAKYDFTKTVRTQPGGRVSVLNGYSRRAAALTIAPRQCVANRQKCGGKLGLCAVRGYLSKPAPQVRPTVQKRPSRSSSLRRP
jgi:hypothetical protein